MAVGALTGTGIDADLFRRWIPRHVVPHEQIQAPIAIVVEPPCRYRPRFAMNARLRGDIFKGAITAVAIEKVAPHAGHEQVLVAVVIEIARRGSHAEAFAAQTGLRGDILEVC